MRTKSRTTADREHEERDLKGRRTVLPMSRLKVAEATDDGKRKIEGYAAVFGNRDSYGDVILKGAFEKTLVERPDVKVLWQHDPRLPIGKQVDGFEDEFGLRVQGELSAISRVEDEVVPLLLDGVVSGLSIGYDVIDEEYNPELNCWFLKEIDLFEWSPVTFPANELASVTEVKELGTRRAEHLGRLERAVKTATHELEGFFQKSDRRADLNSDSLRTLHALLGDSIPGLEPSAADAQAIATAYYQGGIDALDAFKQIQTQPKQGATS